MKGKLESESIVNKKVIITALNRKGQNALIRVLEHPYTEKEKSIINIEKLDDEPLKVSIHFTTIMQKFAVQPKTQNLFKPFSIGAVLEQIVKTLEEYGASLYDVDIEVQNG